MCFLYLFGRRENINAYSKYHDPAWRGLFDPVILQIQKDGKQMEPEYGYRPDYFDRNT